VTRPLTTPPRWLVALDPGSRRLGLALFDADAGRLVAVKAIALGAANVTAAIAWALGRLAEWEEAHGLAAADADLVSEWPRKYASNRAAWDDVDSLRRVVRGVEWLDPRAAWQGAFRVAPGKWGASTPKHVRSARNERALRESLGDEGLAATGYLRSGLDGRDATGIGLWALSDAGRRVRGV
jgi:hypothetical protein